MDLEEFLHSFDQFTITDIEVQKKDNNRISVFLNHHFAFGLSIETYEKYPLKVNETINHEMIDDLLLFEKEVQAGTNALKFLGIKARTELEVRKKLKTLQYGSDIIDKIIENLKSKKILDDLDFTEMMVRDFVKFKKEGVFKLIRNLKQKGISAEIIEEVLEKYISPEEQLEKALYLGQKKYDFLGEKENKKEKIYRFLMQKGFKKSIVIEALGKIFKG
ncbi:MAG: RecX family transcriptional regulator [Candidatus Marinimicrobia bacterium]|nr:RecX family transcriptional regulator [Candidatus Neomarinimicrobiota bacterium]